MHWVTTRTTSNALVRRIALQHNRSVFLLSDPSSSPQSSTKQGELEHRRVKKLYKRTNKVRFERQIAKHERMQYHYRKYVELLSEKTGGQRTMRSNSSSGPAEDASPQQHYSVANKDRSHVNLYKLSVRHMGDPALKVTNTVPKLLVPY